MFSTQAFILDYKDIGEYDRQYFLLTKEAGKIPAICKSVLKPKSKLAGHLEPPNFSWLELVESVRGWQITQALERNSFPGLRKDPVALKSTLKAARFLNDFLLGDDLTEGKSQAFGLAVSDDKTAARVFSLWQDFLNHLEVYAGSDSKTDFELVYSQFILRALDLFGFLPDIFSCSECGKQFDADGALHFQASFFCFACARKKSLSGQVISNQILFLIKQILSSVWFARADSAQEIKILANRFLIQAYNFVL
ncbi:MAG: DNA repair protein RecO C-terminal domain-containing protein [Patescibacteria group bacterium]